MKLETKEAICRLPLTMYTEINVMNNSPQSTLDALNFGAKSQQGTRGKGNDDYYDLFQVDRYNGQDKIIVAGVADGVTTTRGGGQASRIAIETIKETLQEPPSKQETLSEWLEFAIVRANEQIVHEAQQRPEWAEMSTTIVLAAWVGEKLYVLHLGDSRAYLIRDNAIYQLTADHTWVQEALDIGSITHEEAKTHRARNQLQRYLGSRRTLIVDRGIIAPGITQREEYLPVQPGDTILLCSDGVHSRISQEEIVQTIIEHAGYPQDAVDELIEKAVGKGERDDITAVLIELPLGKKATDDVTETVRRPQIVDDLAPLQSQTQLSNYHQPQPQLPTHQDSYSENYSEIQHEAQHETPWRRRQIRLLLIAIFVLLLITFYLLLVNNTFPLGQFGFPIR